MTRWRAPCKDRALSGKWGSLLNPTWEGRWAANRLPGWLSRASEP